MTPGDRKRFDWRWTFAGVVFMVAANVLAYWAMRPLLDRLLYQQERVLTGAGLMVGVALLIYFVGGLLVGRMSAGETVNEPAVAGVLALVAVFVLQVTVGMVNIIGLVIGAPFCFGLAYMGGLLGERWQSAAQRRRQHRTEQPPEGATGT